MATNLKDFFQALMDQNLSVNYYLPQNIEEKDRERVLKEIQAKMRGGLMSNMDTLKQVPSSYTISNIWDPLVKKDLKGISVPLDQPIPERKDFSSTREYLTNRDLANQGPVMQLDPTKLGEFSPTFKHETFHAIGQDNPELYQNYWDDWKRSTSRGFQASEEWASSLYRKARAAKEQDLPSTMYQLHWKQNGPTQGLEELAAYVYEAGMKKPTWMSDRDFQIISNYIRTRTGIWD